MSDVIIEEGQAATPASEYKTGRKKADAITAVVLLAFAAYMIAESLSMPIQSQYGPGPGLFPLGLGMILAVLSIALFWDGVNPKVKDKPSKFQNKRGLLSSSLVVVGLVGYALLINWLGYLLTTFFLVLFLMGVVARDNLKTTFITALSVTILLFLIFNVGLGVHLPKGPLGF
ncbi:MAG TPA: tripartite tricarboxylate transporter TctB family protein [Anaerolineaceae bacterium]